MLQIITAALLIIAAVTWGVWLRVFWVDRKRTLDPYRWPRTPRFLEYGDRIKELIGSALAIPFEEVRIRSFDGTELYGRLYIKDENAPVQIMMHGYRENAITDFCGGLQLALKSGMNAIVADQRAHGKSGGRGLSFGILERRDAKAWAEYACERFGPEVPLILTGISMGASTVLMASDLDLPQSVCGVIADCGYTSPEQIIMKVAKEKGYPVKLLMPFARLAARLIGGFDLKEASAPSSLSRTKLPVLFIHGEGDDFVPVSMTLENYKACASEKTLFTVPGAGHGMSFLADPEGYKKHVRSFCARCAENYIKSITPVESGRDSVSPDGVILQDDV